MDETSRAGMTVTPGLMNTIGKGRLSDRSCGACGFGFPVYVGRYPSACPKCGGKVERREKLAEGITGADVLALAKAAGGNVTGLQPHHIIGTGIGLYFPDAASVERFKLALAGKGVNPDALNVKPVRSTEGRFHVGLQFWMTEGTLAEMGAARAAVRVLQQFPGLKLPDLMPWVDDVEHGRAPEGVPADVVAAIKLALAAVLTEARQPHPADECETCGHERDAHDGSRTTTRTSGDGGPCAGERGRCRAACQEFIPAEGWGYDDGKGARGGYDESAAPPIVAVSRAPRVQALIEAGVPGGERGARASRERLLSFAAVGEALPGGVANLKLFLEGPSPTSEHVYFRLEGPQEPVLIFEFHPREQVVAIYATEVPENVLGSDPRAELITEAAGDLWNHAEACAKCALARGAMDRAKTLGLPAYREAARGLCPIGLAIVKRDYRGLLENEDEARIVLADTPVPCAKCDRMTRDYARLPEGPVCTACLWAHIHPRADEAVVTPENSLGIPRADMPQIDGDRMDAFLQWLREQGIAIVPTRATARLLLPTQGELDSEKVAKFKTAERGVLSRRIVTAMDNRILDGHHRWAALIEVDPEASIETIQVQLPIAKLLELARKFDGARFRDVEESLPGRPSNPADISFDPRCFKQDGVKVKWTVSQSSLQSGPKEFSSEAEAAEYSRITGRPYTRVEAPNMVRVSWTCPRDEAADAIVAAYREKNAGLRAVYAPHTLGERSDEDYAKAVRDYLAMPADSGALLRLLNLALRNNRWPHVHGDAKLGHHGLDEAWYRACCRAMAGLRARATSWFNNIAIFGPVEANTCHVDDSREPPVMMLSLLRTFWPGVHPGHGAWVTSVQGAIASSAVYGGVEWSHRLVGEQRVGHSELRTHVVFEAPIDGKLAEKIVRAGLGEAVEGHTGPGGRIRPGSGPTVGNGATRAVGGYRFELGQARKTKVRRDVRRSIQNRINARRGLASRIAAAKRWHQSSSGRAMHRDLGRYNKRESRIMALESILATLAEGRIEPAALAQKVLAAMKAARGDYASVQLFADGRVTVTGKTGSALYGETTEYTIPDVGILVGALRAAGMKVKAAAEPGAAQTADYWKKRRARFESFEPTEEKTVDDLFDGILQKLIAIESTDVLQDVNFTDQGSVYLYFDPVLSEREVQEILAMIVQAEGAAGARIVAQPVGDEPAPGAEDDLADWWVIFVGAEGDLEGPDADLLGASVPYEGAPATASMAVMGDDPVANIVAGVDVGKLLQGLGGGQAPDPAPAAPVPAAPPPAVAVPVAEAACCGEEELAPTKDGPVLMLWADRATRVPALRGVASGPAGATLSALREAAARGDGVLYLVRARGADEAHATIRSGRVTTAGPGVWTNLATAKGRL